jgi:hypothetical protein
VDKTYYCHQSVGRIQYDPKQGTKYFVDWWALLVCDQGIVDYYCWHSLKFGRPIKKNMLWGTHVSAIRGEEPANKDLWGHDWGKIDLWHTNTIRYDNGCHAWLDVWCPKLHEIREALGLPPKETQHFHLTLGRWAVGKDGK